MAHHQALILRLVEVSNEAKVPKKDTTKARSHRLKIQKRDREARLRVEACHLQRQGKIQRNEFTNGDIRMRNSQELQTQ